MTLRQRILKIIYPLVILRSKLNGSHNHILSNKDNIEPHNSVYTIPYELNNGSVGNLSAYKGKKILIVNTASDCGYTNQYEGLQKLYTQYAHKLIVIGFPSNNFKEQEKGDDETIAQFCKINYGITFPLVKKSVVIKSAEQHKIFEWLSNKKENGWLDKAPSWNFCKYLIDETGMLTHFFEPGVEPFDAGLIAVIQS